MYIKIKYLFVLLQFYNKAAYRALRGKNLKVIIFFSKENCVCCGHGHVGKRVGKRNPFINKSMSGTYWATAITAVPNGEQNYDRIKSNMEKI